jgi:hypothetical protein
VRPSEQVSIHTREAVAQVCSATTQQTVAAKVIKIMISTN